MPEVRRGSLKVQPDSALLSGKGFEGAGGGIGKEHDDSKTRDSAAGTTADTTADSNEKDGNGNGIATDDDTASDAPPTAPPDQHLSADRGPLHLHGDQRTSTDARPSLSYALRPRADAYYDSRAATHAEWKRRARTLQEYYDDNPHLLPQLPFTWHHGRRRWRLFLFAFLVFVDGSVVPIALYYGMHYAGHVEGWIIFAVVTTIWGGPTYLEFAIRTLRLVKKERFYRPLGTEGRWCFDMLTWASVLTIAVVTALFVVGSAPHIVLLRVLCMPAPAILYCLGGVLGMITLFHHMDWPAPFRISSTAKGERVLPGAYYFIEDVAAVNAGAGRPFREALAARYKGSPPFRQMLYAQSLFWAVPALALAVPLTVVAVVPAVPATAAYGVCWAVPFLWCALWAGVSVWWCKRDMVRERLEWEASGGAAKEPAESGTGGTGETGETGETGSEPV
ncbi:hypothetical protein TOPH_06746 [Tolypocladium ophioglossoides CBS 100239]|uniref:Uncharacterized protein n=1 Tax=Tolypocladium ophioglossoides (strain CBS 100239) TaxID=1163406 RepID=A0A0L0N3K1_TOLOC|nr:hypothetical protein TOPH_06746 [Tolypocladium ophioglossoides CBS 100239]